MSNCAVNKNPLEHSGTSQAQRLLPGMKKEYALVDEKEYADWIVFASEFAVFINYFGVTNTVSGNWQPFFSNDISAQLGCIAIQDIKRYRTEIKQRLDFIKNDANKSMPALDTVRTTFNELFCAILTLSKAMDDYAIKLPEETHLKGSLQNLIKTKLSPVLQNLIAYYKAAIAPPLPHVYIKQQALNNWKILNKQLTDAAQILDADGLSDNWFDKLTYPNWTDYKNAVAADDSIFQNPLTGISDDYLSLEHAANHNLFTGILDTFLTGYAKIIGEAEEQLLITLEKYDTHLPHYALFLSFLKLYRFARENINTITQRHLDFYYREVLKLEPKPALANKVHILGELAKMVDEYLLAGGTALKAGKDSGNRDVLYTLDNDSVFNKAKVAQLKTFFKASAGENILVPGTATIQQNNNGRIFASPVSNSDDGLGAPLTGVNKEWQPLVHKVYYEASLQKIAMPKAMIGFALASHYLYLTEGERKIFIRFVMSNNAALDGKNIECWLTTDKEWYRVESPLIASAGKKLSDGITDCAEISLTLNGSVPPIVNYNAAIHGGTYKMALPLLKIYLAQDENKPYEYDALAGITLTKAEIRVEVGFDSGFNQKGLKNLLLSNDFGLLDASKPFMPFGPQPKKDTGLVIGHKEIFCKKNAAIKLNIEWADLPDKVIRIKYDPNNSRTIPNESTSVPSVKPQFLEGGIWKSNSEDANIASSVEIFTSTNSKPDPMVKVFGNGQIIPSGNLSAYQGNYLNLNAQTINGFLRLSLYSSFGFSDYIKDLSSSLIEKAPGVIPTISNTMVEPYNPKIKSLYAGYAAFQTVNLGSSQVTDFNKRELNFFHIYPFGEGEQHKYLQPGSEVFLLPQFKHKHKDDALPKAHVGEFYIGLEKLNPGEGVNLLFQVMEGSTNPTVIKPALHVHWFYLGKNNWIEFNDDQVNDNTGQLVQSGIISFAIPINANQDNTIMPAGYIWLRAAVTEAPEAVCKLMAVDAQATVATFSDHDNASDFLNYALPALTISKLKDPDADIKKLSQPYPSFGGRPKEKESHFYIRVSERLRHKARAVTVWDYEHLVLEAFPEIYKVKCLNHTQIEPGIYNEVKPGHVSIITIPSLQHRNDADPLKPFTQQSTLTNIEKYLDKRVSCFVQIHASQPQFEEVRMEFSLMLFTQYKDFTFYANKLKEEITQFLSPWAFSNSAGLEFGGKIFKSVLINFIEERHYVDFITDVKLFVKVDELTKESADMEEITASTARSILVSAQASKHNIIPVVINASANVMECPPV